MLFLNKIKRSLYPCRCHRFYFQFARKIKRNTRRSKVFYEKEIEQWGKVSEACHENTSLQIHCTSSIYHTRILFCWYQIFQQFIQIVTCESELLFRSGACRWGVGLGGIFSGRLEWWYQMSLIRKKKVYFFFIATSDFGPSSLVYKGTIDFSEIPFLQTGHARNSVSDLSH